MTGGTNRVAMISPNTTFFPAKSIRARAYAASEDVTTTRSAFELAAIMEFANHRNTGVSVACRIDRYAPRVGSCGNQVGGDCADSDRLLNDVEIMNSSGLTKSSARTISTTYLSGLVRVLMDAILPARGRCRRRPPTSPSAPA